MRRQGKVVERIWITDLESGWVLLADGFLDLHCQLSKENEKREEEIYVLLHYAPAVIVSDKEESSSACLRVGILFSNG